MTRLAVAGRRIFLLDPEDVPDLVHNVGAAVVTIHPEPFQVPSYSALAQGPAAERGPA